MVNRLQTCIAKS